jgi:predicted metal-dependent peptidase
MAMSIQDQVKREKLAIMKHKKFCAFSGVIACGKTIYSTSISTAMTNGWDVTYNEKFIREHAPTPQKLRFLILHEAVHKAYRHMHVWHQLWLENARLANVAADHFVNLSLVLTDGGEKFIEMLDVGIQPDAKYKGWSVVQIFHDLKKEEGKKPKPPKGKGDEPCDNPSGGGDEEEDEDGNGPSGGGSGDDEDEQEGMDSHDWENASEGDEAQKHEDEIIRAIQQGEMLSKKLRSKDGTGNADGVFGDLLNGKIDWRKMLLEWANEYCAGRDESSWRKVNRRFLADGDTLMAGNVGITMKELVCGWDTSGSCFNSTEMTRFATEFTRIVELVKPTKIHAIYWDTKVIAHQTFTDGQFAVAALKPQGGGGTDGSVLFDYLRKKNIRPDAIVQFTDGYVGSWGTTDVPTLWAVTGDMKAPYGTTIKVELP